MAREDGAAAVNAEEREGRAHALARDLADDGGQLGAQQDEQRLVVNQRAAAAAGVATQQVTVPFEPPVVGAHRGDERRREEIAQDRIAGRPQGAPPAEYRCSVTEAEVTS